MSKKQKNSKATDENCQVSDIRESAGFPIAPDGGWGWVIVLACFYLQAMIDGTFSIFGVFFPQFLSYYGASRGKTAIIGSLLSACMMLLGPFVSVLVSLFGCRKISMAGGILITLGLVLSTLAPNVEVLIVTFGLLGGIGLGLIFQPAVVMVGFWFDRKRALTMGIASSGAGIGLLVLSALSGKLLEIYDWKNALVLMSCITLQSVVCGALLRPVEEHVILELEVTNDNQKPIYVGSDVAVGEGLTIGHEHANSKKLHVKMSDVNGADVSRGQHEESAPCSLLVPKNNALLNDNLHDSNQQLKLYSSSVSLNKTRANPLLKENIFYSGSIDNIAQSGSIRSVPCNHVTSEADGNNDKSIFTPMKEMLSLHILKDVSFLLIALANALVQAAFVVCVYFLTDYGISLGIETDKSAFLVSVFGIGTMVGRAGAGAIANIPGVRPVWVTAVSLAVAGVSTGAIVLVCRTFIPLLVCVLLTGLFIAPIVPLTSVLIVDYLGLQHLTNGHGMVSLAKGLSSIFSAPLAGFLKDTTGSYMAPFCMSGALFVIGGVLHGLLPFLSRRK